MDLTDNQIEGTKLEIVSDDYDAYPLIYHIRDGNKILCKVESADPESTYESFDAVEPYYRQEMEEYTFNNRSKKQGKKQKKAKVILNISNSNSDSESEIEIDEVQRGAGGSGGSGGSGESRESRESIESNDPNETSKTNPKLKSNPNPNPTKDEDPQMKAAIEREQYYALEEYYGNMQKDLFEEIKNRIKIEKKAEVEGDSDNESGSKNSRKIKKSKSKDKEAEKQKQMRQPEKPQTDQIGPSSKKTQQNVRRRRR